MPLGNKKDYLLSLIPSEAEIILEDAEDSKLFLQFRVAILKLLPAVESTTILKFLLDSGPLIFLESITGEIPLTSDLKEDVNDDVLVPLEHNHSQIKYNIINIIHLSVTLSIYYDPFVLRFGALEMLSPLDGEKAY